MFSGLPKKEQKTSVPQLNKNTESPYSSEDTSLVETPDDVITTGSKKKRTYQETYEYLVKNGFLSPKTESTEEGVKQKI